MAALAVGVALASGGCGGDSGPAAVPTSTVDAEVSASPFTSSSCTGAFRSVELDHVVELRQAETAFDANGAGVALGDVDDDGRVDIVLGNLDGPVRLLWNEGQMRFTEEVLLSGRARAVQLVDVDGDDDLDVALAPGYGPPLLLVNAATGGARPSFQVSALPGLTAPAYSMLWLDPDRDDDLDLVVASYDMEFGRVVAGEYVRESENGVWYVEQDDGQWQASQLAPLAHALAVTTADLDDDGDDDLIVGNDYGLPDGAWLWDDGWEAARDLFSVTAANTMSFDVGDVDADGDDDLYATDMAPFDETNAEFWEQMAGIEHDPLGPQTVRNVLLDLGGDDFGDGAEAAGVDATGWSWSGRLADLDHDRDLDLYVANGMLPSPLFPAFPNEELTEPNLAYRNAGDGSYVRTDEWGLGTTASTRGVAAGDLDGDGDLDLVTSTVGSPAQLFVNELCGGSAIVVEPRASGGNTRALGARVTVATESGLQTRTIRSGIGYLSADPAVAHFGLGDEAVTWVSVEWPDGERSVVEAPDPDTHLRVTRPLDL